MVFDNFMYMETLFWKARRRAVGNQAHERFDFRREHRGGGRLGTSINGGHDVYRRGEPENPNVRAETLAEKLKNYGCPLCKYSHEFNEYSQK